MIFHEEDKEGPQEKSQGNRITSEYQGPSGARALRQEASLHTLLMPLPSYSEFFP